jgi:hypothetical protein
MKIYENCIRCSTHSQTVTMYGNQPRSAVAMPWRSWPSASRRSSTWACQSRTKSVGCEAEKNETVHLFTSKSGEVLALKKNV